MQNKELWTGNRSKSFTNKFGQTQTERTQEPWNQQGIKKQETRDFIYWGKLITDKHRCWWTGKLESAVLNDKDQDSSKMWNRWLQLDAMIKKKTKSVDPT